MLSAAALVRVTGPDPRIAKGNDQAFSHTQDGVTAISASGLVVPSHSESAGITVFAPASVLLPFVRQTARRELSALSPADLLPCTRVEVYWESTWFSSEVVRCLQIPHIEQALTSWLESGDDSWAVGWALGACTTPYIQAHVVELACKPAASANLKALRTAEVALAKVPWATKDDCPQGSTIAVVGSPFGVMSPQHFSNTCVHGVISNHWPAEGSAGSALLMADVRCLPGMEGGPVYNQHGKLVAMTLLPLHSRTFRTEVPLLMPIQHLVSGRAAAKKARMLQHNSAASEPALKPRLASNDGPEAKCLSAGGQSIAADSYDSSCDGSSVLFCQSSPGLWAAAIPSVVLVSVPGSGWASGIVMSQDGFILTNAHVVQPRVSTSAHSHDNDNHHPAFCKLRLSGSADWHIADIVYVFKHVLDLAVLRIRDVPDSLRLQPAVLQRHAVSAGQPIAVVGHALFSPDRKMQPSITAGNVSKVVHSRAVSESGSRSAAMLLTSATVNAGASGGALVNAHGCVVGIITSNARHSASGSTIPNLNFAVAADALRSLWQLAAQPQGLNHTALQQLDIRDDALLDIWTISKPPQKSGAGKANSRPQGSARLAELLSKSRLGLRPSTVDGVVGSVLPSKL